MAAEGARCLAGRPGKLLGTGIDACCDAWFSPSMTLLGGTDTGSA